MDERQIGLALALEEVGVSSDVVGFDSRLFLQKTVYLLEEAGIKLGYSFTWYLRGPYSPGLTRDLYDLASSKEDITGWVLDDKSKVIASRIRPLLDSVSEEEISSKARKLELLASVHYLSRRRRVNVSDVREMTEKLVQNGKDFPQEEVDKAIQALKKAELL